MAKPGFTPSLLIGLGDIAQGIIEKTQELTGHWPSALQALIQAVQIDPSENQKYTALLKEKLAVLKSGKLLSKVEQETDAQIRRQFGPLEINVYFIGQVGAYSKWAMDEVLQELLELEYSWPKERGFTGATVTTLALLGGESDNQGLELNRLQEIYLTEQFLDSFSGRILLLDRVNRDGSNIDWADLTAGVARLLYTSLAPCDQPLLLPELGLIRKQEKEMKLTGLGMSCIFIPWRENYKSAASKQLKRWAEQLRGGSFPVEEDFGQHFLFQALQKDQVEKLFVQNQSLSGVVQELSKMLADEVTWRVTGSEPGTALHFLNQLQEHIRKVQQEIYDLCRELDFVQRRLEPALVYSASAFKELKPPPIIVEDYEPERGGGRTRYFIIGFVALAAIYRITANQLIPLWLGWLLALGLAGLGGLYVYSGNDYGEYQEAISSYSPEYPYKEYPNREYPYQEYLSAQNENSTPRDSGLKIIPISPAQVAENKSQDELVQQQKVLDKMLVFLGDFWRECSGWQKGIAGLAEVYDTIAKELEVEEFSVLSRAVEIPDFSQQLVIDTKALLPKDWQIRSGEELKEFILSELLAKSEQPEDVSALLEMLVKSWRENPLDADLPPLLLYQGGSKPVRKLSALGISPELRKLVHNEPWVAVEGPWDIICAVNFHFGIEPAQIAFREQLRNRSFWQEN